MRRSAGDVAGKTIAAQIRQAARNLGFPAESWRVREAWYGRAGSWSAAVLDDLRARERALREREEARATATSLPIALTRRLSVVRRLVTRLQCELAALDAEVGQLRGDGAASDDA